MKPNFEGVTTEQLEQSLLALDDLQAKYEGKPQTTRYGNSICPLCNFHNTHHPDPCGCCEDDPCLCPWFWFTGKSCCSNLFNTHPLHRHFARIKRWKTSIQTEITRREQND